MQNLVIPARAQRILFLGGDNVSAHVLSRILASQPGNASPIASAKVLRPLVTRDQRNNSHSPHHSLDKACAELKLSCNFVADQKKFKLEDLAVTLGMMMPQQPSPSATIINNTGSTTTTNTATTAPTNVSSCPFTVDQVRSEFLNQFDVAVVASFKHYIPDSLVRAMSPVVNMHPSLLPLYRGAAPLFFPVINGDHSTGASIIKISPKEGMDCGDILKREELSIRENEDARTLYPRVLDLGSRLMRDVLENFETHWTNALVQEKKDIKWSEYESHARKLTKEDSRVILENCSGEQVTNLWRAFVGTNFALPFCDFCRTQTPIANQLRQDDKKKPTKVTFSEIVPYCDVPAALKAEVESVIQKGSMNEIGSVYTPVSIKSTTMIVAAVKCKTGYFWIKKLTLFNSKTQDWKLTSTSMMMKPGVVYPGVFRTAEEKPEQK